jgi:hypothetical protein
VAGKLPLLLVLFLSSAAFAGGPEPPSTRMRFLDVVGDGLRHYRQETDPVRRGALLKRLAATRDPRVAVVLGEVLSSSTLPYPEITLLAEFYLPEEKRGSTDAVWDWWRANEADLRRRAGTRP